MSFEQLDIFASEAPTNAATTPTTADIERPIDRALRLFLTRQFPAISTPQGYLASFVSRQLADGHSCVPIAPAQLTAIEAYCGAASEQLLNHNPLISADGTTPLVLEAKRLYLRRYWHLETTIAAHLKARLAEPLFDAEAVKAPLQTLFAHSTATPDWQQLACLLAGHRRIGIITGGPGTGKTTTVVRLLALLQQLALTQTDAPLRIKLAAPTGKAASRLNASVRGAIEALPVSADVGAALPQDVTTLHRLLGSRTGSRQFRHNRRNPLHADLVVIDEASMIDIDQTLQLLEALPERCRLILVGDKDQLASVEAGAVMADLCAEADHPAYTDTSRAFIKAATGVSLDAPTRPNSALSQQIVKLQKNWRSKDAPGINRLAQAINRQDVKAALQAFDDAPQQLRRLGRNAGWMSAQLIDPPQGLATLFEQMRRLRPATDAPDTDIDAWASQLLTQLTQQQLLTPLRRGPDGIEGLNEAIINALYRRQLIQQRQQFAGMPLLVTQNLYDLELMNGDLGLLLDHPHLGLRVAFATQDGIRWILPDQLDTRSQLAFALSVHQSQGSEFKRVLLYLPERPSPLLTRELIYTAVTRASQQFVLLEGASSMLAAAIRQRTQRHSGLALRLHPSLSQEASSC